MSLFAGILSMASEDDGEKANCTITWIIENLSFCWQKTGESIESPRFAVDTLKNTEWKLCLYPRGYENGSYISYFLQRDDSDIGVETIVIDYELAVLAADGSVLTYDKIYNESFEIDESSKLYEEFVKREEIFTVKRSLYLPKDSLTARCRIWMSDAVGSREFFSRTILQVERRSFAWDVEKFGSLEPEERKTFELKSASGSSLLTFQLYIKYPLLSEQLIYVVIKPSDEKIKSLKVRTWLLDAKGKQVYCGWKECLFDVDRKGKIISLLITKKQLIENETLYLPNDVLSLVFECAFPTCIAFNVIDRINFLDIPSRTTNEIVNNADTHSEDKQSNTLLDDLKFLFKNEILCDAKLCTKTETFSVHSVLLSARSPVFRAMFTTDMKEKAKESIDIPDIDADILRQMLQYMYTDTLKIRDWENATLLYAAADKYDIKSMKNDCSSYMKSNFCSTNACPILVLSEMHGDKDLKKTVQDYILKQGRIIFESTEWVRLMEENSKLAAETMHQNWINHKVAL